MKVLIVSDTHRYDENFIKVIRRFGPFDQVIHCGDVEGQEDILREEAGCGMCIVAGNNDYFAMLPREVELEIGKYKIWVTHGHNYLVYMDNETILEEARARGYDIVMYGHTHKPVIKEKGGVMAINPGSLTYPRQSNRCPSFIVMTVDDITGEAEFEIEYLE